MNPAVLASLFASLVLAANKVPKNYLAAKESIQEYLDEFVEEQPEFVRQSHQRFHDLVVYELDLNPADVYTIAEAHFEGMPDMLRSLQDGIIPHIKPWKGFSVLNLLIDECVKTLDVSKLILLEAMVKELNLIAQPVGRRSPFYFLWTGTPPDMNKDQVAKYKIGIVVVLMENASDIMARCDPMNPNAPVGLMPTMPLHEIDQYAVHVFLKLAESYIGIGWLINMRGNGRIAFSLLVSAGIDDYDALNERKCIIKVLNTGPMGETFLHFLAKMSYAIDIKKQCAQLKRAPMILALKDVKDRLGRTPLMAALRAMSYTLMETLLENGADQSITNNDGKTVRELAVEKGDQHAVAILDHVRA